VWNGPVEGRRSLSSISEAWVSSSAAEASVRALLRRSGGG
jgi:hypothetical protein